MTSGIHSRDPYMYLGLAGGLVVEVALARLVVLIYFRMNSRDYLRNS